MSYFESVGLGMRRVTAARSPGCVQCGRLLEIDSKGIYALSGKCEPCLTRAFDGDEVYDDDLEY